MTNDKNKHKPQQKRSKRTKKNSSFVPSYNAELLAQSWQERDELYHQLFGPAKYIDPPDYQVPLLTPSSTTSKHGKSHQDKQTLDLSNQQLAIFTYEPDPLRPYWTYITAGLSTPWLQDTEQEVSGFGVELMIKSPVEADWPSQVLRTMAYYIFNHMGTLSPGKRLGLNSSIVAHGDSKLRNLLIWYADEAPDSWYQLPSGGFGIFTAIGVTDDEMRLTENVHEEYGTWCMLQILTRLGINQVTDPDRPSIFEHENITSIINSVKDYAEQFHQAFPEANQPRGEQIEEQN